MKDDPAKAASLAANIQKLTQANSARRLQSFVVFMAGASAGPSIEKVGKEKGITIPLTFLPGGPSQDDVARYKINPEAKNTVMVYSRRRVHATFVDIDDKSFEKVEKATVEMLNQ